MEALRNRRRAGRAWMSEGETVARGVVQREAAHDGRTTRLRWCARVLCAGGKMRSLEALVVLAGPICQVDLARARGATAAAHTMARLTRAKRATTLCYAWGALA